LQVFHDVARLGSFSQAAALNHLTQSAVTQIVHQLEKRLGVMLIDRSSRPPKPTAEGRRYADACKSLVDEFLSVEMSIRKANADVAGNIRVAAIYSVGLGDMGQIVDQFVEKHPRVTVQIEYLHPKEVYQKVLDGRADLGLVSFPRSLRQLAVLPWRQEPMVLACPPSHPLAHRKVVRPAQLRGQKYVCFHKDLVIRRKVDDYLREHGVTIQATSEFDNIENIKEAIEASAGIALLPEP